MKSKETDIYKELAKGCFFGISNKPTWTRFDCHYFGCLRVQTGCKIYNKLEKDF